MSDEPIKCGRMGPVARVCAMSYAEGWGLEAVPLCSQCQLPVNAGSTRLDEIRAGATLICTVCTGDHVAPNYENRYERRRQADERAATARERGDQVD